MANLAIKYLGLDLKNPVIVGSCGLTSSVDSIGKLVKNGAGAVVLKSIFEEEIINEFKETFSKQLGHQENNLEFFDYYDYQLKDDMLQKTTKLIQEVKQKYDIPVIASINCRSVGEWFAFSAKLQEAGADALELNIFRLATSPDEDATSITNKYMKIIQKVRDHVSIPVSVKMSPYFTDTAHVAKKMEEAGVEGLVMFNRYYNPDIDLVNNSIVSGQIYSNPGDFAWPLRWISILSGQVETDLAGATGVHTPETLIKMLVSGATAVQVVSALYKNGPDYLLDFIYGLEKWMDSKGLKNIAEVRDYGKKNMPKNPEMFERIQFMKHFGGYC